MVAETVTPPILLLGRNGQVGFELVRSLSRFGRVCAVGRADCDLSDTLQIRDLVARVRPAVIVNAAGYTSVDLAEENEAVAQALNEVAVGVLAQLAHASDALLVHYSSDYVYAGDKARPYVETDAARPASVYGRTKLAGDLLIQKRCARHLIFRTSWVFGVHGNNFLKKMLVILPGQKALRVVADQRGAPTSAALIAEVTASAIERYFSFDKAADFPYGIYHLAAAGCTTWHGYAQRIARVASESDDALEWSSDAIEAISTADYASRTPRPLNSRLDSSKLESAFGLTLPPWERDVDNVLRELLSGTSRS